MDIEIGAEAKDKRLNRMVAITVVVLSVFMGLGQVKDGNIVQAMAQAQSNAVDRWSEYQAAKTKLHIDETGKMQAGLLQTMAPAAIGDAAVAEQTRLGAEIDKYRKESVELRQQAQDFEAQYDALNVHDDQFDASDALLAIAISIAAVSALAESLPALCGAWVFGALGMLMGLAGFFGWSLHSQVLSRLLS